MLAAPPALRRAAPLLLVTLLAAAAGAAAEYVSEFDIAEGVPVGTNVGYIGRTTDGRARPPEPPYLIVPVPGSAVDADLNIDENTGLVRTRVVLDREVRSSYSLVAIPQSGENIRVVIRVTDENDNAPTFPVETMAIEFPENTPRDVKRTLFPARDLDLGVFNTQRYNIVSGNVNDAFRLSSHRERDGVLYLDLQINGFLDRETTAFYSLVIEALDGGSPPLRGSMTVNITIQDVNDNQPIFNQSRYFATIPENATIGSSVLQVFATDTDSAANGRVTYSINRRQSDHQSNFKIDPNSGVISVNRPLDFESRQVHELVVVARDNGAQPLETTAFVSIRVSDVNDNLPTINLIFLSEDASPRIAEDAQPGEFVARISVNDPDTKEEYDNISVNVTLSGGDGHFGLKTHDNIIYLVIVSRPLDRELKPNYTLTVRATDQGTPPLVATRSFDLLVTDTNDNAPRFEKAEYHTSVLEVADPGTEVLQVTALDSDEGSNSRVHYSLLPGEETHADWFEIDENTGLITTRAHIDCETEPEPRVTVLATDGGSPPLSATAAVRVTIVDVNDNEPVFDQSFYNVSVAEDQAVGHCILKVSATDPDCGVNAQVNYSIGHGFKKLDSFSIRADTGEICISAPLDHERRAIYEFPVVARDRGGLSTTAMVKVQVGDVNDNAPAFYPRQYNVSLRETQSRSAPVVVVAATDGDSGANGRVSYAIVGGNERGLFRIDRETGEVFVTRAVTKSQTVHHLLVEATDGGGLKSRVNAEISLSVIDTRQQPPIFDRARYSYSVREDVPRGTLVGAVSATSRQSGGAVRYSIYSGDPDGAFAIDPKTGEISTAAQLDHEQHSSVLLNVQATSGRPPTFGHTQVNVTIGDVNDFAPEFDAVEATLSLPENTELRTAIYSAHARDHDSGENGRVRYRLLRNPDGVFGISARDGSLSLVKKVDYEQRRAYQLVIAATDTGTPPLSTNLTLHIDVQDFNDNEPQFERDEYQVSVKESLEVNTQFLQLTATDADTGNNARLTYRLVEPPGRLFGIFPNSGWLYLKGELDRETTDLYRLTVEVTDNGTPSRSARARALVRVLDVNDHSPEFSQTTYEFAVTENMPAGTPVGSLAATDRDLGANASLRYTLNPTNGSFQVDPRTGEISTAVRLDRELIKFYEFTADVSDEGEPPRRSSTVVKIRVLDDNDSKPQFLEPLDGVITVREEQQAGFEVVQVHATDADEGENATVTYSFSPGVDDESDGAFTIDAESGTISTTRVLDHEEKSVYRLLVVARDGGSRPKQATHPLTIKVLDLNDNSPTFTTSSLAFTIKENSPIGFQVGTVIAIDRDAGENGRVSYTILSGNLNDTFDINRSSGALFTTREVDYEMATEYLLQIEAVDASATNPQNSKITVKISVEDLNDNAPTFSEDPILFSVGEDTAPGTAVWNFSATDRDSGPAGTVRYSISQQSPEPVFAIDQYTGALTLREVIDYEVHAEYTIIVTATDQSEDEPSRLSTSVTSQIIIEDVNDHAPVFVRAAGQSVTVREDERVGYPVLHVIAVDKDSRDNGRVTYEVSAGDPDGVFSLDLETGLLSIGKPLDRESRKRYTLNITASDHGQPPLTASALVTVLVEDVNDNQPIFSRTVYTANVSERAPVGTFVARVSAADRDEGSNGNPTYLIPAGIADSVFEIEPRTGEITTTKPLDRETAARYHVTVYARDGSSPAQYDAATVIVNVIDENDHSPELRGSCYPLRIPENSEESVIHYVVASDADTGINGEITYSITDGNVGNKFSIDERTGALSARRLDRETRGSYRLEVTAQDRGSPSRRDTCTLDVRVQDENDNDPVFQHNSYEAHVAEDAPLGTAVLTVRAIDDDLGVNGHITYSLNNETQWRFRIDNDSGKITTAGTFNRERQSRYTFEVQATDGGRSNARSRRATVTVIIDDANDHAPVLTRYPFTAAVSARTPPGTTVVNVTAEDEDLGANGQVTYSFANQPANSLFGIDRITGEVKTTGSLGTEQGRLFHLEVVARDRGSPPQSSAGLVQIYVGEDRGQTTLRFQNSTYRVGIQENAPAGSDVVQVTAVRSDGRRQRVTYRFGAGNDGSTFEINANNGLIRVRDPAVLDSERQRTLRLIVVAQTEGTTPLYGYAAVYVELLDRNDNKPRFTQEEYISAVWEGNSKGTFVVQVSATDADTGANANVVYSIVEGNLDNAFVMESPSSGVVRTNIVLDREIRDEYQLTIIASDQGRPQRVGHCSLHIRVIDINDNRPTFPPTSVTNVSEGAQVGAVVTTVTANDVDTSPALTYSFAGGAARQEAFAIDRFTGRITLIEPLDRETQDQYVLMVTASDTEHVAETSVHIHVVDENDQTPVFSETSYSGTLLELTGPGQEVLQVSASDADLDDNARITYSLLTPTTDFYVEPATGRLFTNATVRFDADRPTRQLVIGARDGGRPALTAAAAVRLRIEDINNHAPEFGRSLYKASIGEDAVPGVVILTVSADDVDQSRHNRNIDYSFASGNDDGVFQITSNTGEIILLRPLDRERRAQYVLEAAASDRGTPARNSTAQVVIDVTDVNDHEPKFNQTEYTASVSEELQVGATVLRVHATDRDAGQNAAIVYDITSGNDHQVFTLDRDTGAIRLQKRLDFDRLPEYRFIVRATDRDRTRPLSALATVHVRVLDENDNAPSFPQPVYYEFAAENEPPGQLVFTAHANDADRGRYGRLNYTLKDGGGWFQVDPSSGAVTTAASFDYEAKEAYAFTIFATDLGGRTATAQVRVTVRGVDEFAPVFVESSYRFRAPADGQPGHVVGRVAATDRDRGADGVVVYHLRAPHDFFRVNKTSGEIVVRRSLGERRRTKRDLASERLEVVASSGRPGSLSALASVEVVLDPALNGTGLPATAGSGGLADWGVGLLVAIILIVMAFGAAFVFLHMRNRRMSKPTMADHFDTSFDTDIRTGPAADLNYPPRYSEIHHPYDTADRPAGRNTTSELSEQSHRSASSGRGSAEDGDEDEEIRMINEGPLMQQKLRQLAVPETPLHEEDNLSEASAQNTQEYLARLGIDTSRADSSHKGSQSLRADSIHMFDDERGAEDGAVDLGNLISSKLTAVGAEENEAIMDGTRAFGLDETQPSMTGSLSSIVHSEEELTGSYNWDYLLNWGPQYQPLAHVFSEIARLKDDSAPSPYAVSVPKPPPLLTNVAPRSVAAPVAPRSSLSGGLVTMPSLARSPISHDVFAAQAMSPSFSPALSPLATRSPSMSPHVPRGLAGAPAHHRSHLMAGASSSSESEMRI
ncbi:protein dachsous-like [Amphibalanus amphitrite]|uniref:protein dachsous-like n=1 Tax=Amphibalanus amphitrite TaxID=1232801 RepID=UPI001C914CB5|nr:protein dachsous-like [Amphibalanus amphitrite]